MILVMLWVILLGLRSISEGNTAITSSGYVRDALKDMRCSLITKPISKPAAQEAILAIVVVFSQGSFTFIHDLTVYHNIFEVLN